MADLVVQWQELPAHAQGQLLADPWDFAEFLESVGGERPGDRHMRTILCFVAWPNVFHLITSADTVAAIRRAYAEYLAEPGGETSLEVQRDLFAIQVSLERVHGGPVDFYRPPFDQWRSRSDPLVEAESCCDRTLRLDDSLTPCLGADIATQLHVDAEFVDELTEVLQQRKQMVFYGPPGTGKTFIARRLAEALAGHDNADAVSLVQFHPSYSYEDFFEGFRPVVASGGSAGFQLHPGPLKLLAERAARNENAGEPLPHH